MEEQYTDELYHHGVKGMKWGVRKQRQPTGGSLKQRWKQHKAEVEKKKKAKAKAEQEKRDAEAKKSRSILNMNDADLKSTIDRMMMEKQALQLKKDIASLTPQKVSLGKQFLDESVIPAVKEAGKSVLTDYLKKIGKEYLGLDEKDAKSVIDLAKESTAKRTLAANNDWFADREAKAKAAKQAEKEAKKEAKAAKKAEQKEAREAKREARATKQSEPKVYKVKGEAYVNDFFKSGKKNTDTIYDAEWRDVSDSGSSSSSSTSYRPSSYTQLGRSYVAGLLEEPK